MASKTLSLKDLLTEDEAKDRIPEVSFEDGLRLLGELVEKVETGTLPLDRAIAAYERGAMLVEHLRQLLSGAEAKLKVLSRPSKS